MHETVDYLAGLIGKDKIGISSHELADKCIRLSVMKLIGVAYFDLDYSLVRRAGDRLDLGA